MKIEHLTIHNIASLKDAEINFSEPPLSNAGIFLISGDIGAGKSTILDCICLALYGSTPRLKTCRMQGYVPYFDNDDIKINNPAVMLRRTAGEGFVILKFKGNDNLLYEAAYKIHRANNKPTGRLQPSARYIKCLDKPKMPPATKESEINDLLANCVGLDFEQFRRTTMLAQGDFAQFLNSKDDDKASLLARIIGKDEYSRLGSKIFSIYSEKNKELENLSLQLNLQQLLSPEEEKILLDNYQSLQKQNEALQKEYSLWLTIKEWLSADAALAKELTSAKSQLSIAIEAIKSSDYIAQKTLVTDYDNSQKWRDALSKKLSLQKEQTSIINKIADLLSQFSMELKLQSDLHSKIDYLNNLNNSAFDTILLSEEYQSFEQSVSQQFTENLLLLPHFNDIPFLGSDREEEYFNRWKIWIDAEENINRTQTLNSLKDLYSDIEKIIILKSQYTIAINQKEKLAKTLKNQSEEIAKCQIELKKADDDVKIATQLHALAEDIYNHQRATLDNWARDIRANLHIGDFCPVCHKTISEPLPSEEEFIEFIKPAKKNTEKTAAQKDDAINKRNSLKARIDSEQKSYTRNLDIYEKDNSSESLKSQIDIIKLHHPESLHNIDSDTALSEMAETINKKIEQIQSEINAFNEIKRHIERELISDFHKRKQQVGKRNIEISNLNTQLMILKDNILKIKQSFPEWNDISPSNKCSLKTSTAADLLADVQTTYDKKNYITSEIQKAIVSIEEEQALHPQWSNQYIMTLASLNDVLVAKKRDFLDKCNNDIKRAENTLQDVTRRIKEHSQKKPQQSINTDIELATAKLISLNKQITQTATESGAILEQIKTNEKAKKAVSSLQIKIEKQQSELIGWKKLNNAIGDATGKKFQKIALSYVLEGLVIKANKYLETLMPRYSLIISPGSYIIMAKDKHMAQTIRPTSVFSGGETFLASLALALALADFANTLSVDMLFIDEGFGSLSNDALSNAIDTLRSLSGNSGKQVGIISHIEELREKIPVQLRVIKKPNSGYSIIKTTESIHT